MTSEMVMALECVRRYGSLVKVASSQLGRWAPPGKPETYFVTQTINALRDAGFVKYEPEKPPHRRAVLKEPSQ